MLHMLIYFHKAQRGKMTATTPVIVLLAAILLAVGNSQDSACWSDRLEGKYIREQHGSTKECYSFEEAKKKCEAAADCHGIATQSNVCGGRYRVTHGTKATLLSYGNWKAYNLWAYTLNRNCGKGKVFRACEHQGQKQLSCPAGQEIAVSSAFYGRRSTAVCGYNRNTNCIAGNSQQKLNSLCNGKQSCTINPSNGVFGDPCGGVVKYAEVNYECRAASSGCWSNRLEGKYIKEQHGSTKECYGFEEAKKKCEAAADCHGIATQSNVCGGRYRVTHGTKATLLSYGNWKAYNLWAYTLDRKCGKACVDNNGLCPMWAKIGECCKNPAYMLKVCRKACGQCGSNTNRGCPCMNNDANCEHWASIGECQKNPNYMLQKCKKACKVCVSGPIADKSCNGFDLLDDELDKMVADTGACKAVEVMKTMQANTLCNAAQPQAFGKAKTMFKNGVDVGFICDIISSTMRLGILIPPDSCRHIHDKIINPIMNGRSIGKRQIESLVKSQLEGIIGNVVDQAKSGVDAFNSFVNTINACPTTNLNPNYWKAHIDSVVQLIKAIKMFRDKGPKILQRFAKSIETYNCKTYSVVFTADLSALAIVGVQRGIYVTWHMDQGFKELGLINGVSASYNIDPDMDISVGGTVALLMGTKEVWGEWGYTLEMGASVPIYGVGVGFSGGLVFTADANTKALGTFVGFSFSMDFSLGESSTTVDFDASVTCGYVAASAIGKKLKNQQCIRGVGNKVNALLGSLRNTENVFEKKWDELKKCGDLYLCQAKQCAYGFSGGNFKACQSAAGKCGSKMNECGKWSYTCEKKRIEYTRGSCSKRACRSIREKTCGWVPNNCGPFSFACNAFKEACKWTTKTVCDGACITWEQVAKPVTDTIVTAGSCVGGGFVAVAEKTKCVQYLPLCTSVGGCYIGQGAISSAQCAGGMIVPSEKCLKDSGLV